jgi:hypothetical protein
MVKSLEIPTTSPNDEGAGWHMALTQQVFEALQQVPLGGGSWMIWENHRTQQGVNGLFQDME